MNNAVSLQFSRSLCMLLYMSQRAPRFKITRLSIFLFEKSNLFIFAFSVSVSEITDQLSLDFVTKYVVGLT